MLARITFNLGADTDVIINGTSISLRIGFHRFGSSILLSTMKRLTLIISMLTLAISQAFSQQDSISLKPYCPTQQWQEGATCASYATAYTALSTLHNSRARITDQSSPQFKSFSYGFVASKMKQQQPWRIRVRSRCGLRATSEQALEILANTGTVSYKEFPDYCDCSQVDANLTKAGQYRIKRYAKNDSDDLADAQHIEAIKQALRQQTPVVVAVLQTTFFAAAKGRQVVTFPAGYAKERTGANHVVCILGFNDTIANGSFLVKNNYQKWGQNGFAYVPYTDMIKLVRATYMMNL